jgi:UDP-glucose 4-epimerase
MVTQKTVMVTGGAGYIGSHTALELLDNGWTVVIVDNLSTGNLKLVPPQSIFYNADIGDSQTITDIIKKHHVMAIMHFAGSIIVPESVENPLKYYLNNTLNSYKLIEVAKQTNIKSFVFSSTAAVYGIPETESVSETSTLAPINPYGSSKLMTEQMLQDVHKAHGLHIGILRYFNVAGADKQGRSGQAMPNATHLIKVTCEVLTGKRPSIDIFGTDYPTPDGTCVRDYIHVTDLAKAHILVLNNLMNDAQSIIVNCGYGRGFSVREVLDTAEKVIGHSVTKIESPRRAGDPPALIADNTYLTSKLGWKPQHNDLYEIIHSAFNWEKNLNL